MSVKKFLSVAAAILCAVNALCCRVPFVNVNAVTSDDSSYDTLNEDEATSVSDFEYTVYNEINPQIWVKKYIGTDTDIVIPSEIDGLSVTQIGNDMEPLCENLTSVKLPDNLKYISWYAFSGMSNLTSINIPDGVLTIGSWAFYNCTGLTTITIPESVLTISDAFSGCSNLKTVTIKNPECEIDDSEEAFGYYFTGTIYGYENSTAQAYAEKYNKNFVSLGQVPVETTPAVTTAVTTNNTTISTTSISTTITQAVTENTSAVSSSTTVTQAVTKNTSAASISTTITQAVTKNTSAVSSSTTVTQAVTKNTSAASISTTITQAVTKNTSATSISTTTIQAATTTEPKVTTSVSYNYDINNDGQVNQKDYDDLNQYIMDPSSIKFDDYTRLDVDGNGVIDLSDLMQLKNYLDSLPKPGDIDGDGEIRVADVVKLQKYLVEFTSIPNEDLSNIDLNEDGKINVFDVIALKRIIINS
ncbi:leucine-rich repeat protein [Porcipelethomonas sp.]|uniref:leucine-rich repeat protein n=1 Tax=Porcipelethomonas sp. TaxID=2981675 RepID=UPI003EF7F808